MSVPHYRAPGLRWPVPNILSCLGMLVLGLFGWTVFLVLEEERGLEQLFHSEAHPSDRVQSAEQWAQLGAEAIPRLREALASPDHKTRGYGILALVYMDREAARLAEPDVLRLCEDPDVKVQGNALVLAADLSKTPEQIAPMVAARFLSSETYLVEAAVSALHRLGPSGVPAVADILPRTRPHVQVMCLDLLKPYVFDETHGERATSAITECLGASNANVRQQAYQLVSALRPLESDEVAQALSDSDLDIVKIGLTEWTAAPRRDPGLLSRLVHLLNGPSPLAVPVLDALAVYGPSDANLFPAILKRTKSEDPAIRGAAAAALVRTAGDAERVLPILRRLLRDSNPDVARRAARLLTKLTPEELPEIVRSELLPRLHSQDETVQISAAAAISGMPHAARAEQITLVRLMGKISADGSAFPTIHYELAGALGNMGPAARDVSPAILDLIRRTPPHHDRLHIPVLALAKIGAREPEVLEALIDLLHHPAIHRSAMKIAVVEALGQLGGENQDVFEHLLIAQQDDVPTVRVAVLRAISQLNIDVDTAQSHFSIALNDNNVNVRVAACLLLREHGQPEEIVMPLSRLLEDHSCFVRILAAHSLADLGPQAREAIPALARALEDRENSVSHNLLEGENEGQVEQLQWELFDRNLKTLNRNSAHRAIRSALAAIQNETATALRNED